MVEQGWYDDPEGLPQFRYWDGAQWSEHVHAKEEPQSPAAQPAQQASPAPPVAGNARSGQLELPSEWCRACGAVAAGSTPTCASCAWKLSAPPTLSSSVGLIFEQKSRLGRTSRGVCIAESQGSVTLHVSAKSTVEAEAIDLIRTELTAAQRSIAGRLYRAADLLAQGTVKAKWEPAFLTDAAWSWATADTDAMRGTFDDCVDAGWTSVADALTLSRSEKAWRQAHAAASRGDVSGLAFNLQDLPDDGYPARAGLLFPFLEQVLAGDTRDWIELIRRWAPAVPARTLLLGVLGVDRVEVSACSEQAQIAAAAVPSEVAANWLGALQAVTSDSLPEPPGPNLHRWSAYRWLVDASATIPAPAEIATLTLPLLDDAVDAGRIDTAAPLSSVDVEDREYLVARFAPGSLDIPVLRRLGHEAELARRLFLNKGATELAGLSGELPKVRHYRALLKLVSTGELEVDALIGDEHEALAEASHQRELIAQGELDELSDSVAADASLWTVFSELALRGKLRASPTQRLSFPEYAEWIDLHRVLELVWTGEYREAADLGGRMADQLTEETLRDEVLNLRAFALATLGDSNGALACLEDAMEGDYTQALLINTGIVAAEAESTVATKYLNKLILEAPSLDLQVAAMDRAVQLWMATPDLELHPDTAHCLYHLIAEPSLSAEHYVPFLRLAARYDFARIAGSPPTTPAEAPKIAAWEIFVAMARMRNGEISFSDYIDQVITTSKRFSNEPWIDSHRENEIEAIRQGLFEDLGEGVGAAFAADRFLQEGSQFLARHVYFFFSIRTALQLAFKFHQEDGTLSDEAASRLLYVPAEEFLVEQSELPPELVNVLSQQFYRAFSVYASFKQDVLTSEHQFLIERYNVLAGRVNWDHENRRAILRDMNAIIQRWQEMIDEIKRVADRVPRFTPIEMPDGERPLIDIVNDIQREWQSEVIRLRSNL